MCIHAYTPMMTETAYVVLTDLWMVSFHATASIWKQVGNVDDVHVHVHLNAVQMWENIS